MAAGGSWSVYRDYTFNSNSNRIASLDDSKAREIAQYLRENPTYRVALDGSNEANVGSVRTAMIDAGVAANRIQTGAYGDPQLRADRRVAVLIGN
jgi:outer membrane protein OmpA-like peptidoglycan-associated protein